MFTDVKVDIDIIMNAIQDVHVVTDLDEVEVVTVDGKAPFVTCEVHINVDGKLQVRT